MSAPDFEFYQRRKHLLQDFSRWLGAQVCIFRGHRYFYSDGVFNTNCAYLCVRCCELDRPIESLPEITLDDWPDIDGADAEKEAKHDDRRWFSWLPFPKWL